MKFPLRKYDLSGNEYDGILLFIFEIHIKVCDWSVMLRWGRFFQNTLILVVIDERIHCIAFGFVQCKTELELICNEI